MSMIIKPSEYVKTFWFEAIRLSARQQYFYHLVGSYNYPNTLDINRLKDALQASINMNYNLRSNFYEQGGTLYQIIHDHREVVLEQYSAENEAENKDLLEQKISQPFNLAEGPLFRFVLIDNKYDQTVTLLVVFHHVALDGTQYEGMMKCISNNYLNAPDLNKTDKNEISNLEDYLAWEQEQIKQADVEYWVSRLKGYPSSNNLPYKTLEKDSTELRKFSKLYELDDSLYQKLSEFMKKSGYSIFNIAITVFATLISLYSNQEKVIMSHPFNTRSKQYKHIKGCLVNTLLFPFERQGKFIDHLKAQKNNLSLIKNWYVETIYLLNKLEMGNVSFNVGIAPTNLHLSGPKLNELPAHPVSRVSTGPTKLFLHYQDSGEDFRYILTAMDKLFDGDFLDQVDRHFKNLLRQVLENPEIELSSISCLSEAEYNQIVYQWNDTDHPYPKDKTIQQLFEEQVEKTPNAVAVSYESQKLTYAELNQKANQLARYIQKLWPDKLIGLCVERSIEMMIGILGILKAGAAYVPIDPNYPKERINYILTNAKTQVILTQRTLVKKLSQYNTNVHLLAIDKEEYLTENADNLIIDENPNDLAYVIYTSGTTGKPKGVMIEHRGLCNLAMAASKQLKIDETSRVLQFSSISFDAAVYEWVTTLVCGGCLCLVPSIEYLAGDRLLETLNDNRITVLTIPPSVLATLTGEPLYLKTLAVAGEVGNEQLFDRWYKKVNLLLNAYGPTEATVCTSATTYDRTRSYRDIGRPLPNMKLYILNQQLQPVPIGVIGELYIGGVGVARGYLNNPDLTQERFIPNPLVTESNQAKGCTRLYKTGDLARYLPDGDVEYIGRSDFQVKIHGYRIELGEIETVLDQYPEIRQAVVLVKKREDTQYLVGYYTGMSEVKASKLQRYLSQQLPEYMIPNTFFYLPQFPLTVNGKVDRAALPEPILISNEEYVAPSNKEEEKLCKIWEEVLKIKRVGVTDDFFRIGGDSILSIQVVTKSRREGINFHVKDIFDYRTIQELVKQISVKPIDNIFTSSGEDVLSVSQELLDKLKKQYEIEVIYPANSLQQGFIYHVLGQPDDDAYRIQLIWDYEQNIELKQLKQAWKLAIQIYPALRLAFNWEEGLIQIFDKKGQLNWVEHDISEEKDKEKAIAAIQVADRKVRFDLSRPSLFRIHMIKQSDTCYTALLCYHHSILDGWSNSLLLNKVHFLYEKLIKKLPIVIYEERSFLETQHYFVKNKKTVEFYWKDKMKSVKSVNDINKLFSHSADIEKIKTISKSAECSFLIPEENYQQLKKLARTEGVTLNVLVQFAWHKLLQVYTDDEETIVGTTISGRNIPIDGIEEGVGLYINTLPLIVQWENKTVREALKNIHRSLIDLEAHGYADLATLQTGSNRLFHSLLAYENYPIPENEDQELKIKFRRVVGKIDYALGIVIYEKEGLHLKLQYAAEFLDNNKAMKLLNQISDILNQIPHLIEQSHNKIRLITEIEWKTLVTQWSHGKKVPLEEKNITELFEERVKETPNAIALAYGDIRITYDQLNKKSNQLANYLRKRYKSLLGQDMPADTLISLCIEKNTFLIIGILGILKAGAAYVPIDPNYPAERTRFLLEDTRSKFLLTQNSLEGTLPTLPANCELISIDTELYDNEDSSNLTIDKDLQNLAYIIYTSGTTGKPKGVLTTHSNFSNFLVKLAAPFFNKKIYHSLSLTTFTFDLFCLEYGLSLSSGGTLVISSLGSFMDDLRKNPNINLISQTPSTWEQLLNEFNVNLKNKDLTILIAGEAAEQSLREKLLMLNVEVVNGYGPTEVTICSSFHKIEVTDDLSLNNIGKPLPNVKYYILNKNMNPVSVGMLGELYIGGVGVSRGYLNQPTLTMQRFIPDPFVKDEGLIYKSGDWGKWLPNGEVDYVGRMDEQVKFKGIRIELGEISKNITVFPKIIQARVLLSTQNHKQYLLAYFVTQKNDVINVDELRKFLQEKLPIHMVPAHYIQINKFPLTANGKLDVSKLPLPSFAAAEVETQPSNEIGSILYEAWKSVLGDTPINPDQNFFDVGGNSVKLIALQQKIKKELSYEIPIIELFRHVTITEQEKYLISVLNKKKS